MTEMHGKNHRSKTVLKGDRDYYVQAGVRRASKSNGRSTYLPELARKQLWKDDVSGKKGIPAGRKVRYMLVREREEAGRKVEGNSMAQLVRQFPAFVGGPGL